MVTSMLIHFIRIILGGNNMKTLLVIAIAICMIILILRLFAKNLNFDDFETDSAEAEPAKSKTDEADSVDSKTDETDSEELPDFLEYELNEEKKRLKMMRKTSLKMVEKSFDKLEKTAESKTKSKAKDIEAETDEYVIFSMNKFNNPQSQYSPYIDKNDANSKKN